MKSRSSGASGINISAIVLGCMPLTKFYEKPDEAEATRAVHQVIELGMTFLDTADAYTAGANEAFLGKALAGKRQEVVLATKFGAVNNATKFEIRGDPEYVHACCDASLKRLNTDVIDLYYQHRVDPRVPIAETVGAMADLVAAGKVRALGLSEVSEATLKTAHAVHPISALQTEYALWARDSEQRMLDVCREIGVTFVAYSPLGRGFLSGAIKTEGDLGFEDRRRLFPRFAAEQFSANRSVLSAIEDVVAARGCTAAQVALAWVLAKGDHIVPISGSKRPTHIEQNAAAIDIELSPDDMALLDRTFTPEAVTGERAPESFMDYVNL